MPVFITEDYFTLNLTVKNLILLKNDDQRRLFYKIMTFGKRFMAKKILLFTWMLGLMFLGNAGITLAQDVEFSQYYAAPLHLNPAMAGISYGPRVNVNYRNQWPAIQQGYVSYAASFDMHVDKLRGGLGVVAIADRVAGGLLNTYSVQLMYSYQLAFSKKWGMKMGISGGIMQRSVDWGRLRFGDQIDPVFGFNDAFNNPNPTQELTPENLNFLVPDFGAGVVVFSQKVYGGIALKHLNRPKNTLRNDEDARLPLRIAVHAGTDINLAPKQRKKNIFLSPNILLVQQSNFFQLNIGTYFLYNYVFLGGFYRHTFQNQDALIALAGIQVQFFKIGYSYDITMSDLGLPSGGAHEVSLSFNMGDNPLNPKRKAGRLECPRLFNF